MDDTRVNLRLAFNNTGVDHACSLCGGWEEMNSDVGPQIMDIPAGIGPTCPTCVTRYAPHLLEPWQAARRDWQSSLAHS